MTIKPMPYQKEGVYGIRNFDGCALLADEMGLGKTPQALWYALKSNSFPALIICPAGLKINWKRETKKFIGLHAEILSTTKAPRRRPLHVPKITIINYDILGAWEKYLKDCNFKLVVMDEIHYVKNPQTKRSKATNRIAKQATKRLGLSGTPLTNEPIELWFPLHIIRPELFPSRFSFAMKYCQPEKTYWGWKFKGARNLKQLHKILKDTDDGCMIRRRKKDVLDQLPDKSRHVVPMDITNRKEYTKAENDFINWLREKSPAKAHRAKSAVRLTQMGYLIRLSAKLKIRSVEEWVDNFLEESSGKLILLGRHVPPVLRLADRYANKCVAIHGGIAMKDRQRLVDKFNQDKNTRIIIGNSPLWTGWNLVAADTLAFFEMAWTPGDHDQGEARPHRIGQEKKVSIYYLIATDTIEEKLCKIIQRKQKITEAILDGVEHNTDYNIFDLLESAMLNKKGRIT